MTAAKKWWEVTSSNPDGTEGSVDIVDGKDEDDAIKFVLENFKPEGWTATAVETTKPSVALRKPDSTQGQKKQEVVSLKNETPTAEDADQFRATLEKKFPPVENQDQSGAQS